MEINAKFSISQSNFLCQFVEIDDEDANQWVTSKSGPYLRSTGKGNEVFTRAANSTKL